jgi:PAS domain S-box-containing protein
VTHVGGTKLDFRALFEAMPASYVVLDPDLVIVAVSDHFLRDTMTTREQILGHVIFEVFPDNPDDANATGTGNLRASLDRVRRDRVPDGMAVQKYDVQRPQSEGGEFVVRYWSPMSTPVTGPDGRLIYILIQTQDVTKYVRLQAREAGHLELIARLQERTQRMEANRP